MDRQCICLFVRDIIEITGRADAVVVHEVSEQASCPEVMFSQPVAQDKFGPHRDTTRHKKTLIGFPSVRLWPWLCKNSLPILTSFTEDTEKADE
jgi:hypothetical protein